MNKAAFLNANSFSLRAADYSSQPTKVQYLDRLEESVLATEILQWPFATVILDVREAAGPKYVIIAAARQPIEVWHSPLIIHHIGVSNEVRSPGGLAGLQ